MIRKDKAPAYTAEQLKRVFDGIDATITDLSKVCEGANRVLLELDALALYIGSQMAHVRPETRVMLKKHLFERIEKTIRARDRERQFNNAQQPAGARGVQ